MATSAAFVDHYALLGCSIEASRDELKHAYREKLREFHPDKRPNTADGHGQRVTQALNEAWEILQDAEKREVYDYLWRKEQTQAVKATSSPQQRADALRHEGNELYNAAQAIVKHPASEDLHKATMALQKYQAAVEAYSQGLELCPRDHRLFSNRALCYAGLKDWSRCREDAKNVTELRPDYMKGWFLLGKALWREGRLSAAQTHLQAGLRSLPGNQDLLHLLADVKADMASGASDPGVVQLPDLTGASCHSGVSGHSRGRGGARSVSPATTPTVGSRVATPPPIGRPSAPSNARDRSSKASSRSPVTKDRHSSKSPGPAGQDTHAETFVTARFGEATAEFGHASSAPVASVNAGRSAFAPLNNATKSWVNPPPAKPPPPPPTSSPARGRSLFDMARNMVGRSSSRSPGPASGDPGLIT